MLKKTSTLVFLLVIAFVFQANLAQATFSWQAQTSDTTKTLTGISFATSNIGIAAGYNTDDGACDGILKKTTNAGTTWENAGTVPTFTCGILQTADVSTYYDPTTQHVYAAAVFDASMGGRGHYFTTDNLASVSSWTDNDFSLATMEMTGVKQTSTSTVYTIGSDGGTGKMYKNSTALTNTNGLGSLSDIDCVDDNTCWTVGGTEAGYTNNGTNFTGGSITGVSKPLYGIDMIDSSHGYAVGDKDTYSTIP